MSVCEHCKLSQGSHLPSCPFGHDGIDGEDFVEAQQAFEKEVGDMATKGMDAVAEIVKRADEHPVGHVGVELLRAKAQGRLNTAGDFFKIIFGEAGKK